MESNNNINDLLQEIQTSVGEEFVFEKEKIETVIKNDEALFSGLAVKILSILGGIIGSIFFTGFLALTGIWESSIAMIICGSTFIGVAIAMGKTDKTIFLDTINIALWGIGIALLVAGVLSEGENVNVAILLTLVVGTVTFLVVERFMLQFLSALLVCSCMVGFILYNEYFNLIHVIIVGCVLKMTYIHLNEASLISKNKFYNNKYPPLQIGLVFCLIGLLILVGKGGRMADLYFENIWISSLTILGAVIFAIKKIMDGLSIEEPSIKPTVLVLSGLMLLPTIFSPFISGAILILILNYHIGHRTGIAVGMIALVYSVMQYYYDLNFTLLQKSGILILSGILFLVAYFIFKKKLINHEAI